MARKTANQRARERGDVTPPVAEWPENQNGTVGINDLLITIGEQQVQIRSLSMRLGQFNEEIARLRDLLGQNAIGVDVADTP